MRIAFFSDNFFPEISGISDSIFLTGEELRRRGHEVLYVAPRYAQKDYAHLKAGHVSPDERYVVRLPSIPMLGSPTGQSRIAIACGTSLSRLRAFKPDVIHTQSPFGTGLEALLVSRVLKVPLVGTNHTPIEEFVHYVPLIGKLLAPLAQHYFAWYYNRCVFVTAPFEGLLVNMRAIGFRRPSQAQPNPVQLALFSRSDASMKAAARASFGITGPVILYSGRLAPEKHVEVVIQALARLAVDFPTIQLLITGRGTAEAGLRSLAEALDVTPKVHFAGFVSQERLAEAYRASDVFAMMSTAETQSLSLMQAYASGVPAVVARAGALPDYAPDTCARIVTPGDSVRLAHEIKMMLADESLYSRMSAAAVVYAQQFSLQAIGSAWEEHYRQAIS